MLIKYGLVLLLFSCSLNAAAHVEKTYYLKGKVGVRDLAIKMLCYDELPTRFISYFFKDDKKDRQMEGRFQNNAWHFYTTARAGAAGSRVMPQMKIAESRDGSWKGTWTDSVGQTQELQLAAMPTEKMQAPVNDLLSITEMDAYEQYRLSNVEFIKVGSKKQGKLLYCDWYAEKESGIRLFRVRYKKNDAGTASINASLKALHLAMVQRYYQFMAGQTGFECKSNLSYIDGEVLSVQLLSTAAFGAGKPVLTRSYHTFDIATGRQLNLEDLLWLDTANQQPAPDDLYKVYKYRKTIFAPYIFGLLQQHYAQQMQSDSCGINKPDNWVLPNWSITKKGFAFALRNDDTCEVMAWAILPFAELLPYMSTKYHLKKR